MSGRQVLKLIDQDHTHRLLNSSTTGRIGHQYLDRPIDLLVKVEGVHRLEAFAVAREHLRQSVDVAAEILLNDFGIKEPKSHRPKGLQPRCCWILAE